MTFNFRGKPKNHDFCTKEKILALKSASLPEYPTLSQIVKDIRKPKPFDPEKYLKGVSKKIYNNLSLESLVRYHTFPGYLIGDRLIAYSVHPGDKNTVEYYKKTFGINHVQEIKVDYGDVFTVLEDVYRDEAIDNAINNIENYQNSFSAKTFFTKKNKYFFLIAALISLAGILLDVWTLFLIVFFLIQFAYFGTIFARMLICLVGSYELYILRNEDLNLEQISDEKLPLYTILVPVYKEERIVEILLNKLKNFDYPKGRIEVMILMEKDDIETIRAAKRVELPKNWHIVIVPDSGPKTKPKACNYGLQFAQGKQITIYDAEDIPDPDQLKKAVAALRKEEIFSTCAQSQLNFFNHDENFITRLFTLEYSYHFDVMLPGLAFMQMPIPLGGTSNHFKTEDLKMLKGWDPYNVTEDADLGMRLFIWGIRILVIESTTYEEANSQYWNWVRQRSRWLKGFMQTAIVYNRSPGKMLSLLGLKNWIGFQFMVTAVPLFYLLNPIMMIFTFFTYFVQDIDLFHGWEYLAFFSLLNITITNGLGVYLSMYSIFTRKKYHLILYAFLSPVYWLFFHSLAAYKGLWQLFTKPFYWEKTEHGITEFKTPD